MKTVLITLCCIALLFASTEAVVRVLDGSNFDAWVDGGTPALVEFYAPWCGHCKRLAPEYEIVGNAFDKHRKKVVIAKVDCDAHKELCAQYDVKGYPTLNWFPKTDSGEVEYEPFQGGRTAQDMINFINKEVGLKAKIPGAKAGALKDLTDATFDKVVLDKKKGVFVEFYAPWCGHCKKLEPDYKKFAEVFQNEPDVVVARVDADSEKKVASKYGISGYPTLKWFPKDNKKGEAYSGARNLEDLVEFVNSKAGTQRQADGSLSDEAGLIKSLKKHVAAFKKGDHDAAVAGVEKAIASFEGQQARLGKVYLRAMKKVAAGEDSYLEKEMTRLDRMIDSGSLTGPKADEFQMRINVLRQFEVDE